MTLAQAWLSVTHVVSGSPFGTLWGQHTCFLHFTDKKIAGERAEVTWPGSHKGALESWHLCLRNPCCQLIVYIRKQVPRYFESNERHPPNGKNVPGLGGKFVQWYWMLTMSRKFWVGWDRRAAGEVAWEMQEQSVGNLKHQDEESPFTNVAWKATKDALNIVLIGCQRWVLRKSLIICLRNCSFMSYNIY